MKLLISENRIAGTALDTYQGPMEFIQAPDGFDVDRLSEYEVVSGEAVLPAPPPLSGTDVDAERDKRIAAGFIFQGKQYQSRPDDMLTISGAAQMAFMAVVAGSPEGNLRWANPDADFEWIAADNTRVKMDAQTVVALGTTAANHKSYLVFKGNDLKQLAPIPEDFTDDSYWV